MKEGMNFITLPFSEAEKTEWMDKYKEEISKWPVDVQKTLWPPELREEAMERYYNEVSSK